MGYFLKDKDMDALFQSFKGEYEIYAPMNYEKGGLYADTDRVRYGKPGAFSDIVWEKKAEYSMKEVLLPITQILFYYTEDNVCLLYTS